MRALKAENTPQILVVFRDRKQYRSQPILNNQAEPAERVS